jgi:RND superfamily putative drug exporter
VSAQGDHPGPGGGRIARGTAALLVRLRWWVIGFWALACLGSLFVLPSLSETQGGGDIKGLLPKDTPAVETELRSVELFGFPLLGRTVIVQRDPNGLSVFAQARTVVNAVAVDPTQAEYAGLGPIRGALPITNALGAFPSSGERDTTALTYLLFEQDVSFSRQSRAAARYVDHLFKPRDHVVGITGSVPARAEQFHIIQDALPKVEALTLGAIVLIVGVAFRSVVAPLVAVLTTGVAYVMTLRLSGAVADVFGVSSPSELEPVIVALLLGVVTDYVVFYLSALRRELTTGCDRLDAARAATVRYGPIVAVAGLAVAAGTGALLVAESLFFRALGPALVFTVLVALLVAVTLVPALMAVLGGWAFWPTRPVVKAPARRRRASRRMAMLTALTSSRRRAAQVVVGCVGALSVAALPLLGLNLGVSFVGSLPAETGVRQAAAAARAGFAPGILSPTTVLVEGDGLADRRRQLAAFGQLLDAHPGVAGVLGPGDTPRQLEAGVLVADDGNAARYLVVLEDPALGGEAIDSIGALGDRLPALLASAGLGDATVGLAGDSAAAAFIVDQTSGDLVRIGIAALAANLLMLVLFLRAVVAAVYLLIGSILSLAASLGLTMLVFGQLDPGAGLTFYVPFAAAVLLVAFGSDYNIFAVGNIWEEARTRPLPEAIVKVMPGTVSAILTAGLALAASFGLLAVVPLVPFRQLAFVMFVGIMLDVLVVRALLMPALLTLFGRTSAWPSKRLAHVEPDPPLASSRPSR